MKGTTESCSGCVTNSRKWPTFSEYEVGTAVEICFC